MLPVVASDMPSCCEDGAAKIQTDRCLEEQAADVPKEALNGITDQTADAALALLSVGSKTNVYHIGPGRAQRPKMVTRSNDAGMVRECFKLWKCATANG